MKKVLSILTFCLLITTSAFAQSPIGQWKTIDDETGEEKSIVEIFEKDGKLFGKVVKLLNRTDDPVCDKCDDDDERYNKKVVGMEIIRKMEKDGDEWENGTVLDPEKGKVYTCKLWVNEDNSDELKVRGYIAFVYRTQTWHRVK